MSIFLFVVIFVILLHLTSLVIITIFKLMWSILACLKSKYYNKLKKGLEKGKARKFYTYRRGGVTSFFIFIVFMSLLIFTVIMFIKFIETEKFSFQIIGFITLFIDFSIVLFVDNMLIPQQKIVVEMGKTNAKSKRKISYIANRIHFFINNSMSSFYMVVCVLLISTVILTNVLNKTNSNLLLSLFIAAFILLSLYSNTFIIESRYFNNEDENPFKSYQHYDIYITHKKIIIYTGVFLLSSFTWYQELLDLEKNFDIKNYRGDLVLITTILLFLLSTDRIFKLIHDDYIKFKKETQ